MTEKQKPLRWRKAKAETRFGADTHELRRDGKVLARVQSATRDCGGAYFSYGNVGSAHWNTALAPSASLEEARADAVSRVRKAEQSATAKTAPQNGPHTAEKTPPLVAG